MCRSLLALALLVACTSGADDDTPIDTDTGIPDTDDTDTDTDVEDTDTDVEDTDTDVEDTGLDPADDPGAPEYPEVIDHLTVTVRTGDGTFDGADNERLFLCLTDEKCVRLETPDVDDHERSQVDVYHVSGLALARADVDRVELRSTKGDDQWQPACLQVSFDGEPVYCNDALDVEIGNGSGEVMSWSDPSGLHRACTTCEVRGPLSHGPMVGAGGPTDARVWVRTDATRRVGLRMAAESDLSGAPVVAWAYPRPQDDFTAVLRVEGLTADTVWHYGIEVDGELVHQSTLRTAPDQPGRRRFALGSCAKDSAQSIFDAIDDQEPDVMVFLGDNHYGNTTDLGAQRWFYRWSLDRAPRRRLLDHVVTVATWDDHDFVGNNTSGLDAGGEVALQAFREFWANPAYGTPEAPGAYTVFEWGDVDLFLLDDRTWRDVDGMLGAAQTAWLLDAVAASDATFKLVATGSQWTRYGTNDSWQTFAEERDALFRAFEDRDIDGLVLLSGDVHRSEIRWTERDVGYRMPELTASPLATFRSPCLGTTVACYAGGNSFMMVDVDTSIEDPTLTATIHDEDGGEQAWFRVRASSLR